MTKWDTPKLVVLAKGTPEEHVLEICKNHVEAGPSNSPCKPNVAGGIGQLICQGVTGS